MVGVNVHVLQSFKEYAAFLEGPSDREQLDFYHRVPRFSIGDESGSCVNDSPRSVDLLLFQDEPEAFQT